MGRFASGRWWSWLPPYAEHHLDQTEEKILACVKTPLERRYVTIKNGTSRIWTVVAHNNDKPGVPIVLLHGLCFGVASWTPVIDAIYETSTVYMIDLLGFGKSSRPPFSSDGDTVEAEFVDALEEWRSEMELGEFVLLGHSFGAYVAASYALKYPDNLRHLILVDPWGFSERPSCTGMSLRTRLWSWLMQVAESLVNPMSLVRAAGPLGLSLFKLWRCDIENTYAFTVNAGLIMEYIYHCNIRHPSAEIAFMRISDIYFWARKPMNHRVADIHADLPITMIHGSRSWISTDTGYDVKRRRAHSYVDVQVVEGASHLVFADTFSLIVRTVCERVNSQTARTSP